MQKINGKFKIPTKNRKITLGPLTRFFKIKNERLSCCDGGAPLLDWCGSSFRLRAFLQRQHPALASNSSSSLLHLQRRQLLPSPAAATAPAVAFNSSSALSHLQRLQLLPSTADVHALALAFNTSGLCSSTYVSPSAAAVLPFTLLVAAAAPDFAIVGSSYYSAVVSALALSCSSTLPPRQQVQSPFVQQQPSTSVLLFAAVTIACPLPAAAVALGLAFSGSSNLQCSSPCSRFQVHQHPLLSTAAAAPACAAADLGLSAVSCISLCPCSACSRSSARSHIQGQQQLQRSSPCSRFLL